ncbi:MAG: hypothetical protein Q9222_000350 [Ikaeria aurantiellina]
MDTRSGATTDDASIVRLLYDSLLTAIWTLAYIRFQKPVSSLLTHFERISHHAPLRQPPQQSRTPDCSPQSRDSITRLKLTDRLSFDLASFQTPSDGSSISGARGSRSDAVIPVAPVPGTGSAHEPRATDFAPSQDIALSNHGPPVISVHSPASPSKFTRSSSISKSVPLQVASSSAAEQRSSTLGAVVSAKAPVPNRAKKPDLKLSSTVNNSQYLSMPESKLGSRTMSPAYAKSPSKDVSPRLVTEASAADDRVSPSSTPPSSDDSLDASTPHPKDLGREHSSPVWQHTAPFAIVSDEISPRSLSNTAERIEPSTFQSARSKPAVAVTPNVPPGVRKAQRPELPPRPLAKPRNVPVMLPQASSLASTQTSKSPYSIGDIRHVASHPSSTIQQHPRARKAMNTDTSNHDPSNASRKPLLPDQATIGTPSGVHIPLVPPISSRDTHTMTQEGQTRFISTPENRHSSDEYPDGSATSRRPPYAKTGRQLIHSTYDTKLFDMCAGHITCGGQQVRVWDLSSGDLVMSIALGERETRATALAFKPGSKSGEEGSCLWIGTNYGELREIHVSTNSVLSSNFNAHGGRGIVKIHRYQNTMWTIDEAGTVYAWPAGDSGLPMLETIPPAQKVPRGHTFSIVVDGLLWLAAGTELRIFRLPSNESGCLYLKQQQSYARGVGDITSGAVVASQLDRIYFGHTDGKISVCSTTDYSCLGIVSVSAYKTSCLAGAGPYLWAGYNTGRICVYNTLVQPWKVIKDWQAHEGPVANLSVDRSSLWMCGLMNVGSVSPDNTIRLWDGLLQDDWFESELRAKDTSWCNFREIEAVIMTWNAGAATTARLRSDAKNTNILSMIVPPGKAPDLLIFGFQELVDLEDKKLTATAGQTQTLHRNNDLTAIMESSALPPEPDPLACYTSYIGGGDGSMILDHEICMLNGDLNYRIDTMSRDVIMKAIQSGNRQKILERDQLLVSRRRNPAFGLRPFTEHPIEFDPTYKYDVGSDTYDSSEKHRAPAWCDRILYRGPGNIKQLDYRRHELRVSDHRPVSAAFRIRIKAVSSERREKVRQHSLQGFEQFRQAAAKEVK